MYYKNINIIALPVLVLAIGILIIIFSDAVFAASLVGLNLWFTRVLPGVLPFLIIVNILMRLGAVDALGVIFAPFMRLFFRLPGITGFALVAGIVSGYPVGAKVVCDMYKQDMLTKKEAQRTLAFANNAGPLFILGSVSSMFGNVIYGYFILIIHYLSAITLGIILSCIANVHEKPRSKFLNKHAYSSFKNTGDWTLNDVRYIDKNSKKIANKNSILKEAYSSIEASKSTEPFGNILAQAVSSAMEVMLMIGGFIVLFSIISQLLISTFDVDSILNAAIFAGIIEMTNGVYLISQMGHTLHLLIIAASLISFGGFSIFFQSVSFMSKTGLSVKLYFLSKLAHVLLTIIIGILLSSFVF